MSKNLAISAVALGPSPAVSGLSLTVTAGQGGWFYTGLATAYPSGSTPTPANAEIVSVTPSGDVLTLVRAQEGSTAQAIAVGWVIEQGITAGMYDALVTSIASEATARAAADSTEAAARAAAVTAVQAAAAGVAFFLGA